MNSDLGFLLIFIILPTILIVSGFWLILLFRKESRIRELSQANMPPGRDAREADALPLDESPVDAVVAGNPASDDAGIEREAPMVVPPMEEFPEQPGETPDEEFWSAPLTDEAQPVIDANDGNSTVPVEPEPITGPGSLSGFTERIPVVDESPGNVEEAAARPSLEAGKQAEGDSEANKEPVEPVSDDTAALPDDWDVDFDGAADAENDAGDAHDPERRRRQPGALLVPSTENVRRRTGATSRKRATPISRSVPRDEDTVEGTDRG